MHNSVALHRIAYGKLFSDMKCSYFQKIYFYHFKLKRTTHTKLSKNEEKSLSKYQQSTVVVQI